MDEKMNRQLLSKFSPTNRKYREATSTISRYTFTFIDLGNTSKKVGNFSNSGAGVKPTFLDPSWENFYLKASLMYIFYFIRRYIILLNYYLKYCCCQLLDYEF